MSLLLKIYQKTPSFLKDVIDPIQPLYFRLRSALTPDKVYIRNNYKRFIGRYPDIDNPKSFNEKLQWLKLYDRTPLHTQCADKFLVRDYVKDKIGEQYLIPLCYETDDVNTIGPDVLPDYPVIIKTNHDSSGGFIIKDKYNQDWKHIKKTLKKFLSINYYHRYKEWQYKNIKPRLVVEKLLMDNNGGIPFDYKLHFFNGKLMFTQVDIDRQTEHKRNLYDKDWNLLEAVWLYKNGPAVKRPEMYDDMIEIGAILAAPFCYARIDLYYVNNAIYFGEVTFHAESGTGNFIPEKWDYYFGERLNLHKTRV